MAQRFARLGMITTFGLFGWSGAAALTAAPAAACAVAPGATCAPDHLTISGSATQVSSKSATITPTPPDYTADYTETVYRDPNNNLCNSPGQCLTWAIKVSVHSTTRDTVTSVSVSNFAGFNTDIGYTPPPTGAPGMTNPGGGIVPVSVDRSGNGSVLEWNFGASGIGDGQSSVLLVLETNATRVVPGTISTQDGVSGSDSAFGPALPEAGWVPGIGLVGGALAGGFLYRRRRAGATS